MVFVASPGVIPGLRVGMIRFANRSLRISKI
jgi:hypothetical protein